MPRTLPLHRLLRLAAVALLMMPGAVAYAGVEDSDPDAGGGSAGADLQGDPYSRHGPAEYAYPEEDEADPARSIGDTADDAWITTKVKSGLLADSEIGGLDIAVHTRMNTVHLSGVVESAAQIERAARVAERTEGVREVVTAALRAEASATDRE